MTQTLGQALFLIRVSRPIVWPVLPLVFAFGMRSAHAEWSLVAFAQMVLLSFPMSLIGCGLNDIHDYESDKRSPRRRAIWGASVSPAERHLVFHACVAFIPVVILCACLTRNQDNVVATTALVVLAWTYSVPPYRLRERPPLDSIANGLGYFLLPLMMGYSLGASPREMPLRFYLLGLCVAGIHALASAADFDADRAAGQQTFAIAFGRRSAAAFATAAFVLAWWFGDFQSLAVRRFLELGSLASLISIVVPRNTMITTACAIIFVGFLAAAAAYLSGL